MLLHLVIIGIARAVSAPSEGTALTGQNNYESNAFCHFDEKEQNAGGPPLHRPHNVDVNGTSECAKQKIRTSLFFYEHFLSQFQKSNNSYCISKRNFLSGKEKNYPPYIDLVYRKRNLLGIENKSQVKISNSKRSLGFMRIQNPGGISHLSEKIRGKITKLTEVEDKRRKKDLKNIEINDELDINKGIEKLVEQIALENLRTEQPKSETEFAEPSKEFMNRVKGPATVTRDSSSFFKRIFSFNKEHSDKNITNDGTQVGSVPVKIVQGKDPIPVVKARNGSYELLRSVRKPTRFRRNLRKRFIPRHTHHNNAVFRLKNKLNMQSDAFGDEVNNIKNFSHLQKSKKFIPVGKRKKRRGKKRNIRRRNEPAGRDSSKGVKRGAFDSRPKRNDETTSSFKQIGLFKKSNSVKDHGKEKLTANPEKFIFYRRHQVGTLNENLEGSGRGKDEKMNKIGIEINVKVPPRTVEKPVSNSTREDGKGFKYELPNDENLTPFRYLKIRHALRNYLIHNDVWAPARKEYFNEKREKRYGTNSSSKKCWKSAPLLCIPYIRKGQDEMLKQIMKSVQRMIEKPIPDKVEIFEKTKFKPCIKKEPDNGQKNCNKEGYQCQNGENTSSSNSKVRTSAEHKNRGSSSQCRIPPAMQCSPAPNPASPSLPLSCPTCPPCSTQYSNFPPDPVQLPTQIPTRATYPPQCPKCPTSTKHGKGSSNSAKSAKCSPQPTQCPKCSSSTPCSKCSRYRLQSSTSPPFPTQCPVCPPCPIQLPTSPQNQSSAFPFHPTWPAISSSSSSSSSFPKSSSTKLLGKLHFTTPLHISRPTKFHTERSTTYSTIPPILHATTASSTESQTTASSTGSPTNSSSTGSPTNSSSTECPTTSSITQCPTTSSTTQCPTTTSSTQCATTTSSTQCPTTTSSTQCPTTTSSTQCPTTTSSTQCPTTTSSTQCPTTTSSTQCPTTTSSTQCPTTTSSTQCPTTVSSTQCPTTVSSTQCPTTSSTLCSTPYPTQCPTTCSTASPTNPSKSSFSTSSNSPQSLSTIPSLTRYLTTSFFSSSSPSTLSGPLSSTNIASSKKLEAFSTYASFTTPELLSKILPITITKPFSKTPFTNIPPFPLSDLTLLPFSSTTMFISRVPKTTSPNPNEGMVPNFPDDPIPKLSPCITTSIIPTQGYLKSTPMALRHFFQTLQTDRPNHCSGFPPCGNAQCSIFNGNMRQITTPTSYFSPTTYFLNTFESENPPILTRTLSQHFFSNRSNLQANPTPSTASSGSWCLSKPPIEQTEYFSFPALPFTASPDVSTNKCSAEEKSRVGVNQQSSHTQMSANRDESAPLNLLSMRNNNQEWASSFTSLDSTESIEFSMLANNLTRISPGEKGFEGLSENNKISEQSKHMGLKKKLKPDEDYKADKSLNHNFLSNKLLEYMQDNENLFKKITKARRHRLNSKFHHKPDMELPNYDFYERHPFVRSTEKNARYHKYPLPWLFHQKRSKKHAKKRHLKRQKREDHYDSSDEDPNYVNENYKDAYYGDSYSKDFQSVDTGHSSAEERDAFLEKDSHTTPLFFALFSELAKVVAQPKAVTSKSNNEILGYNSKSPEKRKSSDFNGQNDVESYYLSSALEKNEKNTSLDTTATFQNDTEFTTNSLDETTVRKSTLKCKVTIRRKKTTNEDSTISVDSTIPIDSTMSIESTISIENTISNTIPLISDLTTTPSSNLESTTCYCVPITTATITAPNTATNTATSTVTSTVTNTVPPIIKPCRPRKKPLNSTLALPTTTAVTDGETLTETTPYFYIIDEDQMPSTLKTANIVKGPKKVLAKPSPKTYTKVYPDSLGNELDTNDASSPKNDIVKKIPMHVFPISNTRLQLLAVCEGYLEVVKLIKAQNQSIEEGLDADLSRYCESIISQSFSFASDKVVKMKKAEIIPTAPIFPENVQSQKKHRSRFPPNNKLFGNYKPLKELTSQELRDKIMVDILSSPIYKRELAAKTDLKKKKKTKTSFNQLQPINKRTKFKGKKYKNYRPNSQYSTENPRRFRRKGKKEDELLGKGIPEEQMKLLHLLRKRKRALLSWLFNSKEDQMKPDNTRETEYLDDEEYVTPDADLKEASGKITPKVDETIPNTTTNETSFVNPSMFPVYAKNYGYDKGGELREVEVLWRKVNEKTNEKKIFKNQSVLALLLAPSGPPYNKPEGPKPWDNEDLTDFRSKSETKTSFPEPTATVGILNATVATRRQPSNCSRNDTQTIISKPDPSSIVGTPPNATIVCPNTTHKISHALAVAKDLFQEYIIEFLNYAVYILPIMFTLLFLFCCVCCFLQVLRDKKNRKKKKRKKKRKGISDDETNSENNFDSESECKKKIKRKKQDKGKNNADNLEKKTSKTIWSVLRLNSAKPSSEFNDDNSQAEKRSFLWFLKGKKDEGKIEELPPYTTLHELDEKAGTYGNGGGKKNKVVNDSDDQSGTVRQNSDRKKKKEDKCTIDEQNEASERRELIALLEELKKIEMEKEEEKKKEQRSVYVQYMRQEEDNCFCAKGENRGKQLGKPRGRSLCQKHFPFEQGPAFRNYELYQDVGELTELLPCEPNYYSKRSDYLRRPEFRINEGGRCERFFKIFRDSGVTQNKHFTEMDFMKSGDRSYIFNKYRTISTGTRDELLGGTDKNSETEITDTVLPFSLPTKNKIELVEEMENLKRQLNKKKYVRLKDDGVLCRL